MAGFRPREEASAALTSRKRIARTVCHASQNLAVDQFPVMRLTGTLPVAVQRTTNSLSRVEQSEAAPIDAP